MDEGQIDNCMHTMSIKEICLHNIFKHIFITGSSLYPLVNVTYNIAEISKALKQSTDITHMAVNAWQGQLHRPFIAVITKVVSPYNVDYHS